MTQVNFYEGLSAVCGNGSPIARNGIGIYTTVFNTSMTGSFLNADGDMLIVIQLGK
jgi:homogentisate 1,2-dioxygenase